MVGLPPNYSNFTNMFKQKIFAELKKSIKLFGYLINVKLYCTQLK